MESLVPIARTSAPTYALDDCYLDVRMIANKLHRTEPDDFEQFLVGKVSCFGKDEEGLDTPDEPILLGSVSAMLLDIGNATVHPSGTAEPPFGLFELLDAVSSDWSAAIELFDADGQPAAGLRAQGIEFPVLEILLIDHTWLLPGHQDKRMDLLGIQGLLDRFLIGGNSIALVNFDTYDEFVAAEDIWSKVEAGEDTEHLLTPRNLDVEELAKRFLHLGFLPVGGTTFFVRAATYPRQHPDHILGCPLPTLPSPEEIDRAIAEHSGNSQPCKPPSKRGKHPHKGPKPN